MSVTQFLFLALIALVVTVPTIKLIPRARQSRWFDRVLWGATWLLAFVGAWYAMDRVKIGAPMAMSWDELARTAGAPSVLGALGGALALNLVLWLMDRAIPLTAEELDIAADDNAPTEDVPPPS